MARKALYKHAAVVSTVDDGTSEVGSDEWNADPSPNGMLGFTPQTSTVTIASGALTPTDSITVAAAESGTSDTITSIALANTNQYDLLYLFADTGDTITLTNTSSPSSNGQIKTVGDANETLSSTKPTILIRKGNYWYGYGGSPVIDGGITTAKLAADAVTGAKLADDAVDSEHYTDGSIDTAHIANSQVTTAKIAADAIDGTKIADDAIDSEHYAAASIDNEHLADNAVGTAEIAADAVTGAKIADDQINSEHYVDGSVDLAHLSADCVDGTKIADNAINSEHYTDGSIDNAHLADDAVGADELAADAVVNASVASGAAIATSKLSGAVTGIASHGLATSATTDTTNASNISSGTLANARLPDVAVSDLAAAAVTLESEGIGSNDNDTSFPTSAAVKDYVDTAVASDITLKGNYDASADSPSLDDGSPISGILKGDHYVVSAAGDFFTETMAVGDSIIAKQDSPTTLSHWITVNNNMVTPIVTGNIAADAVTAAKLADDAVVTANIVDSNVTTAKIAADAITGAKIADDQVDSEHYVAASIDNEHLADNAVGTAEIAADAVTNAKIADDSIDSEHYVDGSIDNAHIADDQIDSEHYVDGSIDTAHIGDDQVTQAKIANNAVGLAELASGTDGELITWDANGDPAAVAVGTATHVLTSNGSGAAPTFQAVGGGYGTQQFWLDASAFIPVPSSTVGSYTSYSHQRVQSNGVAISSVSYPYTGGTSNESRAVVNWVPPKNWNNGTIKVKAYWTSQDGSSTWSGNVSFKVSAVAISNDDTMNASFGTAVTIDDAFIAANDLHISSISGAITVGGSPADADFVQLRVARVDSSSSPITAGSVVEFLGMIVQYTQDASTSSD